jgi:hypothetical protein
MNSVFLINLFLFFSRFADAQGVTGLFTRGRSEMPGYDALMKLAADIPSDNRMPDMDYVFGANFDAVATRVAAIKDYYLFVDYGEIECSTDKSNRMQESARIAVTVARRMKDFSGDMVEHLLASEECLCRLTSIRRTLIKEQAPHPWLKDLSRSHTLSPFLSKELSSIGWSLLFTREAYDSFGVKSTPHNEGDHGNV